MCLACIVSRSLLYKEEKGKLDHCVPLEHCAHCSKQEVIKVISLVKMAQKSTYLSSLNVLMGPLYVELGLMSYVTCGRHRSAAHPGNLMNAFIDPMKHLPTQFLLFSAELRLWSDSTYAHTF